MSQSDKIQILHRINKETLEGEVSMKFNDIQADITADEARNLGINLIIAADRTQQESKLAEFLKRELTSLDDKAIANFIYGFRVYQRKEKGEKRVIIPPSNLRM